MKDYKLTLIGLGLALFTLLVTLIGDLDLFEAVIEGLEGFEEYEVDEFIIPLLMFLLFAFFDLKKRQKRHRIELEKVKIYKAMMSSSHHILNNFTNQMMLFKITAQKTPGFNPNVLSLYDQIIKDANTQLEALGSINKISESSIQESVAPKSAE